MTKLILKLMTIIYLICLTSCAEFLTKRTFVDEMDRQTDGLFVADRDFIAVSGDTGNAYRTRKEISYRTPASQREMDRRINERSLERELKRREGLLSVREFAIYRRKKVYLDGISEKIYYLQLPRSERREFLSSKMVKPSTRGRESIYENSPYNIVSDRRRAEKSLFLGMNKAGVQRGWGRPSRVDIAGNPRNENERWTFYDGRKVQKIFFENGVVGGWSSE